MPDAAPSWNEPVLYRGWRIYASDCPIRGAGMDYAYEHEQFDGPEDNRCGHAATVDACKAEIDDCEDT